MMKHAKNLILVLGLTLALTTTAASVCMAATEYDTFPDWEIQVAIPDDAAGVLDGNDYYIYPDGIDGIPYVMLHVYSGFESEEEFISAFTDFMLENHSDLQVASECQMVELDGIELYAIEYVYDVSGYEVSDLRAVKIVNDLTYMFCSKEIYELDMTLDGMLEEVITESVFLENGEPINIRTGEAEPQMTEYWIEDFADLLEETDGDFVSFPEAGFEIFVPDFLHETDPPYENAGYIGYFVDNTVTRALAVQYVYTGMTRDEYMTFLENLDEVEIGETALINGTVVTIYRLPDADTGCFSIVKDDGYVLEFSMAPLSDEDYAGMAELMGLSILPYESSSSQFSEGR